MENPYAAPQAQISDCAGDIGIYSPNQVMAGAFIGGPVGLIWFLHANFLTLGNDEMAKKTLACGVALVVALLVILPWLPENFPSIAISVTYMAVGQQIAIRHQMTREAITASALYRRHSNWRVFGVGLLCLVASVVVVVGPLMALQALGILNG